MVKKVTFISTDSVEKIMEILGWLDISQIKIEDIMNQNQLLDYLNEKESPINYQTDDRFNSVAISSSWEEINNVHIWFKELQAKGWNSIIGFVFKKPDGTFVAPFRGKLVDLIQDDKTEFREV